MRLVGMLVYGAKTPLGRRTMVWRLKSLSSSSLMRAQMPSPKSVPLGTTTAALPGLGGRLSLRMMSWRKSSAVSEVCLSSGKLPRMPRSSSPPKGGLVMMISTRSLSPISRRGNLRLFSGSILGDSNPWRTKFIWSEQIGQWFCLAAEDALGLKSLPVLDGFALLLQVFECLDQKAAGAAGGIEYYFAELRVHDFNHEADDRARCVELAGIAGGVAHLLEHGLVEMAEGVNLVAAGEVNVVYLINHVAEEIAVDHAIDGSFKDGGDHIAPVAAVSALEAAQIGEKARTFISIGPDCFLVIHESDQLVAGDSFGFGGPVAPAVGRIQGRAEAAAAHLGFLFPNLLHVVKEFEEHNPGEHRQAVQIAVEPFVLPHDIPA